MSDTLSFTFYRVSGGSWSVGLPFVGDTNLRANITWGDTTSSTNVLPSTSHTYSGTGPFTAVFTIISGIVTRIGSTDPNFTWTGSGFLTHVSTTNNNTWGLGNYITSLRQAFKNCSTLISVPTNIPSSVTDLGSMFSGASIFNSPNISSWDISNVTATNYMFYQAFAFNQPIGSWNTSRIGSMGGMFESASAFNQDIDSWDVSNVGSFDYMFSFANAFNKNLNSWNTSNVSDMQFMFRGATKFNGVVTSWDVSHVTNMRSMFGGSVFNQPIGTWDVRSVTNMGGMFQGNNVFNQNIGQWNTTNVTNLAQTFYQARGFNQFIRCWNVSKVTTFAEMFVNADGMTPKYVNTPGFGGGFGTPTAAFFNGVLGFTITTTIANTLITIPINGSLTSFNIQWGDGTTTTNATISHTYVSTGSYEIYFAAIVANINTFGPFNVVTAPCLRGLYSSVYSTWGLGSIVPSVSFAGAINLVSVPLSIPVNFSSALNMFNGATSFNQNISSWDTFYITDMTSMFESATLFNQNIGGWNVSNATNMSNMFRFATAFNNGGSALTWSIGTGTQKVTNMTSMFESASNFNQAISTFITSSLTNLTNMFKNATAFSQNIRSWVIAPTTTLTTMFYEATAFQRDYYPTTPGYNTDNETPLYTFFNKISVRYPCFMEGTQILCFHNNQEIYRPIQELRKGDLVKTLLNGYLPIYMIGTSELNNPEHDVRITNRLYRYTSDKYSEIFEDLYITGCHSILVPFLTEDEWDNTKELLGDVYVTDNHFRLMACIDESAEPYCKGALISIYHIALENDNYYMNYGVYANGLLVESCSKRYLSELSNMRILGEEDSAIKDDIIAMNNTNYANIEVM